MNGVIIHAGRKGMKWYQNIFTDKDGKSRNFDKERAQVDAAKTVLTEAARYEASYRNKKKKKLERKIERERDLALQKITDDDLKQIVTRLNLEKQYRQLSATDINVGTSKLKTILDISGGAVAASGTALNILTAIQKASEAKKKT